MSSFWRADLHSHSSCSDGSHSVNELLIQAKNTGLNGFSITDHDTIEAYHTAPVKAAELDLLLVSGVEFSTVFESHNIHVLGYSFHLQSIPLLSLCAHHAERRKKRNQAILDKLSQYKIYISEEDILAANPSAYLGSIGRPHIAQAMVAKNYVSSIKQAFQEFLKDDACCYVQGQMISTQETLQVIHEAGGIAVIAHPHLVASGEIVQQLLELPFDGIEAYYGTFHLDKNQRWLDLAEKHQVLVTGGSDFHGSIKPNSALGTSWTPEQSFRILWQRYLENNPLSPLPANHDRLF